MTPFNRRRFLKTASSGAGALALGADRLFASQGAAANATAEIVVVGAGAFGGWTALYLREMGFIGHADRSVRSGKFARDLGRRVTADPRRLRGTRDSIRDGCCRRSTAGRRAKPNGGRGSSSEPVSCRWRASGPRSSPTPGRSSTSSGSSTMSSSMTIFARQYPQMNTQSVDFGMYTPSTGVLKAREGCVAVAQAFEKKGGRFVTAKVEMGQRSGGTLQDVALSTGQRVAAQTFVFACGPWLPKVFPSVMKNKLATPRRVVFFYGTPPGDERFTYPNFPTWAVDEAYGFPSIEGKGFKVVPTFERVIVDPDTQEHTLTPDELRKGREFVAKWFPALATQPLVESKVCQREDSIDDHFIVNQHPELTNVWLVGGGSGHGYKHGIMLGDYVANRVVGKDKNPELAATFKLKDASF